MKVSKAATILDRLSQNPLDKKYGAIICPSLIGSVQDFGDCEIDQVTPDDVLSLFGFLSEASKFSIRKDSIQINQSYMLIR